MTARSSLLLATVVFAYAGLSAAQWGLANRCFHAAPGTFMCGNVVSDPFMMLVNVVAPLAAFANVVLIRQCVVSHRWSDYAITATLTFVVTSGCLAYHGYSLQSEYDIPVGRIWWLPWS